MRSDKGVYSVKGLITLYLFVSIVLPLVTVFLHLKDVDIYKTVLSPSFLTAVKHSLSSALTATAVSVCTAYVLAYCICRTRIRGKKIWNLIFVLPMLIPSISHGMGLIITLGRNGIITELLGLNLHIYGFPGIITGSVMYSFPCAYLMILDVMRYEDESVYEAAAVLGISKLQQFVSISLPYLKKPLISVVFATFSIIVTDYGVPMVIGGKYTTLSTMMYQDVIGLLDFEKGSVIGLCLLVPAFLAFIVDIMNQEKENSGFVLQKMERGKNAVRDCAGYAAAIAGSLFVLIPLVSFTVLTFARKFPVDTVFTLDNIRKTFQKGGGVFLLHSIYIAVLAAVTGTFISYITAYMTARTPGKYAKALHFLSILTLTVPGIVLGIAYMLLFKGSMFYGTILILALVNVTHFFSSPYLLAYNSFHKMNENIEAVGHTLGIGKVRMILDIFIPQNISTLTEMFVYLFVNAMITISAVSFLSTVDTMPLALLINQFESQMLVECSAFVSLMLLCINICVKGIAYGIKRKVRGS